MTFDYETIQDPGSGQLRTLGELRSRTLPTGARIGYTWVNYGYLSTGYGSGHNISGYTRAVSVKTLTTSGVSSSWTYTRDATSFSNPPMVTVKDPFTNETVYYYHASQQDSDGRLG